VNRLMVGESLESARVCASKQVSDEHMHESLREQSHQCKHRSSKQVSQGVTEYVRQATSHAQVPQTDFDCALAPRLSTSHNMLVGTQVEWVSRRVKIVGCQACQEWVHEREPDRFATLSQRSMTGVMFAGMKEDRES